MPEFGRIDVYGHLIILSILAIVALRGATFMQDALRVTRGGLIANSVWMVTLYAASLLVFFVAYYAMQRS